MFDPLRYDVAVVRIREQKRGLVMATVQGQSLEPIS
jgi:hypothetical protein